ncbi:MAG: 4Fe-4S dicluster domain-containing protein, partial [Betaproteobacteria bacterium]|nr:4Fe-4S dicluster domain-containing protein [Betaproteobacteria bacterium]
MRAIAEEACALVKQYKGSYSGEHGDGLVRSEWIAPFFGPRLTAALGEIKSWLDPKGLMNPGKIVLPPKMDDKSLFRFPPGYATVPPKTVLDWSEWGGLDKAAEMCNNNGHCRKFDAGSMCPSYRATLDERHLTRGRANTLRLALSGQLGSDALTSGDVKDVMDLCVSCKGCKRECPTGVDMARMKIEFLAGYKALRGHTLRDRFVGYLPRYALWASRFAPLMNLANARPLRTLREALTGFSAKRALPRWRGDAFRDHESTNATGTREVLLFVDTFNRWFEPENARAALKVLGAAGYQVRIASGGDGERPLCCGRTFLAAGMPDEARREAARLIAALAPWAERGVPIIGLEPSCLFGLKDELPVLLPGAGAQAVAREAMLFEEFLSRQADAGTLTLKLNPLPRTALLHGHCHQKAFDAMGSVQRTLGLIPQLRVATIESSCCGMAGSFGMEAEHYDISMKMAETALLPAIRAAEADSIVVADGTSCRHQIGQASRRPALHVARVLEQALG